MENLSKTKLILIRHGQSMANLNGIFAGHTDMPLSDDGLKQAKITAEYLKNEKINIIYSSDLSRAYDTALEIAAYHSCPIIKEPRLREMYGGVWEGKTYSEISILFPDVYSTWENNIGLVALPEGENTSLLQKRIYECIKSIAENNIGKTVCIVTHAMAMRAFCAVITGKTKDAFKSIPWAPNASITTVIFKNNVFTLEKYGFDVNDTEIKPSR